MSRADHISVETRVVGGLVIVVLLAAVTILYFFPESTDAHFSWTILPRATAIVIGAGYAAGAYFFARVVVEKRWHRVQAGFLPIMAFTVCMLAATVLHWSRFHLGSIEFFFWTAIYIVTPFLVPFLWWRNRGSASPDVERNDLRFSARARWALGIVAAAGVLASALGFLLPSLLISFAPWKLTELTARIFAGWSMLTFVTVLTIAAAGRWSATRILLESAMVGQGLALLALPRMWGDLDLSRPMAPIYVAGLAFVLIVSAGLHLWLDRLSQRQTEAQVQPGSGAKSAKQIN